MTAKTEAIFALMSEAQSERTTNAGVKRILRAATMLDLDDGERLSLLQWLSFCDEDGVPYSPNIKRVW